MTLVRVGSDLIVAATEIIEVDCARLEDFRVAVRLRSGKCVELVDQQALDLVMAVQPAAVEGKRFRFARNAWAFHNLVAHPGLQFLAWFGLHRLGFKLHDATVPRPKMRASSVT